MVGSVEGENAALTLPTSLLSRTCPCTIYFQKIDMYTTSNAIIIHTLCKVHHSLRETLTQSSAQTGSVCCCTWLFCTLLLQRSSLKHLVIYSKNPPETLQLSLGSDSERQPQLYCLQHHTTSSAEEESPKKPNQHCTHQAVPILAQGAGV